jgi:DNA polymerase-1
VKDVYGGSFFDVVIASTDKDLYQLLDDNIQMYSPKTKKTFTSLDFVQEYKIVPSSWARILSIAGCSTDNVKGIPNVGIKRAIDYIKGNCSEKMKKKIDSNKELIKRNERLVKLPFEGVGSFDLKRDEFSISSFLDISERYGFRSFTKEVDRWKKAFNME